MTDHPLTDEIIEDLAQFEPDLTDSLRLNRTHDMRAASDWQLKQVLDFIASDPMLGRRVKEFLKDYIYKAMRP